MKKILDLSSWRSFKIGKYFTAKNTGNILLRDVSDGTGSTPFVTASGFNNGVVAYIDASKYELLKGNCILVGGKTFTLTYQKDDFVSNDSHNFTLTLINEKYANELIYLFLLTSLRCSLTEKYSWGDAVTAEKMLAEDLLLPADDSGEPNWIYMEEFIKRMKSQTIKHVSSLLKGMNS